MLSDFWIIHLGWINNILALTNDIENEKGTYLCRNNVPVQDHPQTSLSVVFFGTASLLESSPNENSLHFQQKIVPIKTVQQGLWIILGNRYIVSGQILLSSFFKCQFLKAVSATNEKPVPCDVFEW